MKLAARILLAFIGFAAFLAPIGYSIVMFNAPGGDLESASLAMVVGWIVVLPVFLAVGWLGNRLSR